MATKRKSRTKSFVSLFLLLFLTASSFTLIYGFNDYILGSVGVYGLIGLMLLALLLLILFFRLSIKEIAKNILE